MKFEELKVEKIGMVNKVVRYGSNPEINKQTGYHFGGNQIKELVIDGDKYLRNWQDIEIDWFGDGFSTLKRFYDCESQEYIKCYSVNQDGKVVYVFSDHND